MVAAIQALGAIKWILGLDGLLKGKLLSIRGSDMSFRKIKLDGNPDLNLCGPRKKKHENG